MWFYTVVFLFLIVCLVSGYFFKYQKLSYWFCIVVLILIAAFRPADCCKDYGGYIDYYNNIEDIPLTFLEPSYFIFAEFSKIFFHSPLGIFIVYSILGVGIKGLAFMKLTKYYSISLLLYFCSFFLLHEMTQIRVGVASAILLLSIPSIVNKKPFEFISYVLLGTMFHYSFLIFIFFYFLDADHINPIKYISLILFAFIAFAIGLNLASVFQFVHLGFISDKINTYKLFLDQGLYGDIKLINPLLFLRIGILTFFLLFWEKLLMKNKYSAVIIKIYAFSIFFFIALADLPVLAGRLNQLLGIVEVILVPFFIYILTPKYFSIFIAIFFGILILYKQLYYSDLISSYF